MPRESRSQNQPRKPQAYDPKNDPFLGAITPEDERRLLQTTKQRVKNKYGVSDSVLEKAYGSQKR